ncbi:hypothetical protein EAF00_006255 [Botryotinia globosa]|nr:hypothetical protein EAF00_006255 [Botryotinia globosa]
MAILYTSIPLKYFISAACVFGAAVLSPVEMEGGKSKQSNHWRGNEISKGDNRSCNPKRGGAVKLVYEMYLEERRGEVGRWRSEDKASQA